LLPGNYFLRICWWRGRSRWRLLLLRRGLLPELDIRGLWLLGLWLSLRLWGLRLWCRLFVCHFVPFFFSFFSFDLTCSPIQIHSL